ncbi:ATP-binding protein [Embleya sp. AB8]|uniref:ATP-binding protein n=1 Tax=Embleya sp. AB8 TaxID=3156304 RepID=UPI003C75B66F
MTGKSRCAQRHVPPAHQPLGEDMSAARSPFDPLARPTAGQGYQPVIAVECAATGAYAKSVRDLTREAAGQAGAGADAADTVRLLTGELFANCVRHAPDTDVRVALFRDIATNSLAVSVDDTGRSAVVVPDHADLPPGDAECGYGLPLLRALAADCGAIPFGIGKRVWFVLDLN